MDDKSNKINKIYSKLYHVQAIMIKNTRYVLNRGQDLDVTEKKAEEVMKTSELFMFQTIPWYERLYKKTRKIICCCPSWWFKCC